MANSTENAKPASVQSSVSYVSCIRIHGLRILPPILSNEKRNQMRYYKELALKVEEKIKNRKSKRISDTDESETSTFIESDTSFSDSVIYSSDKSSAEEQTYKSQIFSESCYMDVLNMLKDKRKSTELPSNDKSAILKVPLKTSNESDNKKSLEDVNLSTNIPSKDLTDTSKSSILHDENTNRDKVVVSLQGAGDNLDNTNDKKEMNSKKQTPPLIRSNSYILDTPSPLLLAMIQQNELESMKTNESAINRKRRTWDFVNAKEKWSSIEHDLNVVAYKTLGYKKIENVTFNSLPPSPNNKMFTNIENSVQLPEKESEIPTPEKTKQTIKHVYSAQKISETANDHTRFIKGLVTPVRIQNSEKNVTINGGIEKDLPQKTEQKSKTDLNLSKHKKPNHLSKPTITLPKKPNIISSEASEKQIRQIIEKIHNEQSKQMSELLSRQQKEQENLMKDFAEQQALLLSKLKNTYTDKLETKQINHVNEVSPDKTNANEKDILRNSENLLLECKQLLLQENAICDVLSSPEDDSIPKDFSEKSDYNDNTLTPSPILESYSSKKDTLCLSSLSSRISHSFSIDSLEPIHNDSNSNKIRRNFPCSKQLFPDKKQMWAATKINALVRGYFVRRLIKTEKVQNLIKTIRDTLVCAMELHHDTTDNIQPADVELHRRLIQQVTAACYSFHDIFFELSKSDQLAIIALDRERQKEKLLRPLSAKSNTSLSLTTRRVLERKLKRRSSDSTSGAPSRSSSSRSCYSTGELRIRTKSLGVSDSVQNNKKTSPQNDVMRKSLNYGANKKPWR